VILYTSKELSDDKSKYVKFKVRIKSNTGAKSTIKGLFTFFYGDKDHQREIIFSYKLSTPYTGTMQSEISIFPASYVQIL
jgi:hypothetical protein